MKALKDFFNPETRSWIYKVTISLLVLLGALGIINENLFPPIIGLVGAILSITLADANVPTQREQNAIDEVKADKDEAYKPKHAVEE